MSASITLNRRAIVIASALAVLVFVVVSQSWHRTIITRFTDRPNAAVPTWEKPVPHSTSSAQEQPEPTLDVEPTTTSSSTSSSLSSQLSSSIQITSTAPAESVSHSTSSASATTSRSRPESGTKESWTFEANRDRNDHALTQEQCDQAFPDLYKEIERSQAYWKKRQGDGKLTEEQWGLGWSEEGGLRAMIYDQRLYIIESRGLNHFHHWKERSHATLHNLHRAIMAAKEPIPNIEFSVKIDDNIKLTDKHPNNTVWNFNRNINDPVMEQCWLIPDFNFWAYPRVAGAYGDFQQQAIDHTDDFHAKIPELVWRGTITFNPGIRGKLLEASEGQNWSAVHRVTEDSDDEESRLWRISMPDHCRYKFAVHTEGTTWSGRLKYLLSCHSTILIHPLSFTTHLYHLLQPDGPNQNYVPVDIEFTGLQKTMDELLADNYKAAMIADNAARIFRDQYFTPAAQTCYFRRLFQVWAEMTPTPDPYTYKTNIDGSIEKELRGMTYEEYVFWDKGYPED